MTESANTATTLWAIAFIIVLPVLIVGAGELQERLRQRGSLLDKPIRTLRNWFLPSAALFVIVTELLGESTESNLARLLATAAVVSAATALLQAIRYAYLSARKRADTPGIQKVPRLMLLLPQIVVFATAGWILVDTIWGIDLSGLVAALGVTSLIISLALQPTLSGLASGLLLLTDRPFEPGDWISVQGVEGVVTDVGWRTSTIQDRNRDVYVLPNAQLSEATITNYSKPAPLHRVGVSLQVAYANPPTRAEEMLLAAARSTPNVLEDPAPAAIIVNIDDPLMAWDVHMWVDDYGHVPRVKSDFGALVWYHSNRMGVPLPSPAYDLFHHDPIQEASDAEMPADEVVDHLALAAEFAELDLSELAVLAAGVQPARFRRGELIVGQDGTPGKAYLIWQGNAQMVGIDDPSASVVVGPGAIVGDLLPSSRLRVPHAVVAVTDCEVLVMDNHETGALAATHQNIVATWKQIVAIRTSRLSTVPALADSASFEAYEAVLDFEDELDEAVEPEEAGGS